MDSISILAAIERAIAEKEETINHHPTGSLMVSWQDNTVDVQWNVAPPAQTETDGYVPLVHPCPACHGAKRVPDHFAQSYDHCQDRRCRHCNGAGWVVELLSLVTFQAEAAVAEFRAEWPEMGVLRRATVICAEEAEHVAAS